MIVVKNKIELRRLINQRIEEQGPNCDLNDIDVSGITNMSHLFYRSKFNGDISQWDVSNVVDMTRMFASSKFDGDISKWDTSKVEDMSYMFYHSIFNDDISEWNVSRVVSMRKIFSGMTGRLTNKLTNWDTRRCQ